MKWLCTLIQRRLPDYPDGELSPFWQRRVAAHLQGCADCRREWEELREVVDLYLAHPLPEPEPAFWEEFQRELHLKLAQVNQPEVPARRGFRLPRYLAGAAALAGVVAIAVYLAPFTGRGPGEKLLEERPVASPVLSPPAGAFKSAPPVPTPLAKPEAVPDADHYYSLAANHNGPAHQTKPGKNSLWPEDDILNLDVDQEVADLSLQEQEALRKQLEAKETP